MLRCAQKRLAPPTSWNGSKLSCCVLPDDGVMSPGDTGSDGCDIAARVTGWRAHLCVRTLRVHGGVNKYDSMRFRGSPRRPAWHEMRQP